MTELNKETQKRMLEQVRREREADAKGRKLAEDLSSLVNVLGGNKVAEGAFIDELTNRSHRTLQQSAGSLFFKTIQEWASQKEKGYFDGRNEYLVEVCHRLVNHPDFEDVFKYGFPLI